jgi:type IV pilus assembly protein PilM
MVAQKKRVEVGIDIGTDSIKAARLVHGPQGVELTNVARVEIYPENVAETLASGIEEKIASAPEATGPVPKKEKTEAEEKEKLEERRGKTIAALKKAIEQADIKEKLVVTAVAGQSVIVRYIEIPHMSREELSGAIRFEAEQYIPFELENVELDYEILEEKIPHNPDKMRVLLAAAKKDLVKERLSVLEEAGLKPEAMDVDAFALINAFERIKSIPKEECVALINIGHSITNINILRSGIPYFTRDVFLAGRDITQSLSRKFNLEFNQAEKLKRERGNAAEQDTFNKALNAGLEDLVSEIRLSFDYYENQASEKNIAHAFLTGGTSLMPGLPKFLTEALGVQVEIWNPVKEITLTNSIKEWENIGPSLAVSVGLALHTEK